RDCGKMCEEETWKG
uniref:Conotoxin Cca1669 n=1 Tax=Conus caracteristicus TaxID=89440 RepID=CX69_CONCB|nr:RecName: Full=Conotoxin Cca1669 [Conus caracteristicus]